MVASSGEDDGLLVMRDYCPYEIHQSCQLTKGLNGQEVT